MIRVSSKRKGGLQPESDEMIIDIDRSNPILGNPHVLNNPNDNLERMRVIKLFEKDFLSDIQNDGPMSREVDRITEIVKSGNKVTLRCWCAPKPCHGDILVEKIRSNIGLPINDGMLDFS